MTMLAIMDFVYYYLRLSLGSNKIDALTYNSLVQGLQACGFPRPGVSKFADMNSDLRARIESEEKTADDAIRSMIEVQKELDLVNPGLAKKLKMSMDILNVGSTVATHQQAEEDKTYQIKSIMDQLHRFMNFAESGNTLIDMYYDMVYQIFNMASGQEKGFVIIGHKERQANISVDKFRANVKKCGPRLAMKLGERFKGCAVLPRLAVHMTSPGEIVPFGYIPETKNVVTIDSKGVAKKIVNINAKIDPSEGHDPAIKPAKSTIKEIESTEEDKDKGSKKN
jgi:hypothetical protein